MSPRASSVLRWLLPLGLGAYLFALALATSTSHTDPLDVALLIAVYGLLAAALSLISLAAISVNRLLVVPAALVVGAVVAWHLREQTRFPNSAAGLAAIAIASAAAFGALLLAAGPARRSGRVALAAASCLILFAATVTVSFRLSDVFRWQLLRHNKLIGTPAYFALAPSVQSVRAQLWRSHEASGVGPGVGATPDPPGDSQTAGAAAPNLVFVLVDTLRADSLTAYGGKPDLMPKLDSWAGSSTVFTNVLANASWTRPSVASFFTGLLPEDHGAVDRTFRLSDKRLTIAELLRSRGYSTAAFVTNYAAVGRSAGFAQGFDQFHELRDPHQPYMRAAAVTDEVLHWLDQRKTPSAKPLFLYVHYLDPHMPYLSGGGNSPYMKGLRRSYDAELRYSDPQLRRLVDGIDARLGSSTVVLLTADHGEEFGEHGEHGHGQSLYWELLHIPVIVHRSGSAPAVVKEPLEARDFFDLLSELSRWPRLDLETWAAHRERKIRYASVYITTPASLHRPYLRWVCMRGIQEGPFFLIWSGYGPTTELYDLADDPGETRNLARAMPGRVASMSSAMDRVVPGPWAKRVPILQDKQTIDQLRVLGYVQ